MAEMLTSKEMQDLLHVDRSTIYRMAEAGRLPAVKVGKQWRFPSDLVDNWLKAQANAPLALPGRGSDLPSGGSDLSQPVVDVSGSDFVSLLPLECVQLIQDTFAELLEVMLVVTDLAGQPITQVSNPSPFYHLLAETDQGHALCQEKWQELGQAPALEPRFAPSLAGLLCARAFVRLGNELKGMVIVFGLAPNDWPPSPERTTQLAESLGITPTKLQVAFAAVTSLTAQEQKRALATIQRIADILAHISNERSALLMRLDNIAQLSAFK